LKNRTRGVGEKGGAAPQPETHESKTVLGTGKKKSGGAHDDKNPEGNIVRPNKPTQESALPVKRTYHGNHGRHAKTFRSGGFADRACRKARKKGQHGSNRSPEGLKYGSQ